MNQKTARQRVEELYERKRAEGLLDVKFDLNYENLEARKVAGLSHEEVLEEVFEEVLRMEEAVASGKSTPLNFGDRHFKEN